MIRPQPGPYGTGFRCAAILPLWEEGGQDVFCKGKRHIIRVVGNGGITLHKAVSFIEIYK